MVKHLQLPAMAFPVIAALAGCAATPPASPELQASKLVGVRMQDKEWETQQKRAENARKLAEYIRAGKKARYQRFREERSHDYHVGMLGRVISGSERFFYDLSVEKAAGRSQDGKYGAADFDPMDFSRITGGGKPAAITLWLIPWPTDNLAYTVQRELTILTGIDGRLSSYRLGGQPGSIDCLEMGARSRILLEKAGMNPPFIENDQPASPASCHLFHQKLYERALEELLSLY